MYDSRVSPSVSPLPFGTSQGFTLPELVLIIVLLGILSATILPRFASESTFLERGYQDEVLAGLRYAQKLAIASGCEVQACIGGGCSPSLAGLQLNQRATTCTSGSFTRDVDDPIKPGAPYQLLAPSGIALSSTANTFVFDPLGQASADVTLSIGSGSRQVRVVSTTGYVYASP